MVEEIEASIHDKTVQPGAQLCVPAGALERSGGLEERLLDNVLGVCVIVRVLPRDVCEPLAVPVKDVPEGLVIALEEGLDELVV